MVDRPVHESDSTFVEPIYGQARATFRTTFLLENETKNHVCTRKAKFDLRQLVPVHFPTHNACREVQKTD